MTRTHAIDLTGFSPKDIRPFPITRNDWGVAPDGTAIDFTNYYMTVAGEPFYGVCGEFHYSRMDPSRWDAELAKMAAGGVNVIATYVFWNHHEEHEGRWDFTGRRNLRRFVELCGEHGLKVIVRLGPFDHGEVRNGGIPDWMYGKPYEVRSTDPGFLAEVHDLYRHIAEQIDGLYHRDGGPIIAAQLDNEYMHSSAQWEMTTGISGEWIPGGHEGFDYVHALRRIAEEEGISVPFYTNTGWGGSPVPDDVLPLWGGYAYRPWLFYADAGEHPVTDEYLYRDFHDDDCPRGEEFDPSYAPESKPYACCEMGGGMFSSYNYRFVLPMKSVDAMANIKMASGCNFLGYYMFQGGSNPIGDGVYLNESQVPKISYDFQAALGEFGQARESYRRCKALHYFSQAFSDRLCPLGVAVPDGQETIAPTDLDSLRWCVRTDGERGFVFVNNFQDHAAMPALQSERIDVTLSDGGTVTFDGIALAGGENCMLPFNMDLDGVTLTAATAQPVTVLRPQGAARRTFVFLRPEGMEDCWFRFADGTEHHVPADVDFELFGVDGPDGGDGTGVDILVVSRAKADSMTLVDGGAALVFAGAPVVQDDAAPSIVNDGACVYETGGRIVVETTDPDIEVSSYPADYLDRARVTYQPVPLQADVRRLSDTRYVIGLPQSLFAGDGVDDVRLRIRYAGDIGWLWCDRLLVDDNFANGDVWEVGLREYAQAITDNRGQLVLTITPLKEGANVNVESAMAARKEDVASQTAELISVELTPVYRSVLARS
ncbi:beta-galactosidase [Bifidobacterium samirii]|uniref:Beta-galactosidase n=1 Tax=Bifidobacterium samirii TaxID=2306974 RepID=A0A430FWV1_9BIFI|nr:beta-galactosidase [Bifidobacterium samirii]RSX58519.1 beta-galactosidase [Bifidobacterium samirii]